MKFWFIRFLKRLAIFAWGIFFVYIAITKFFPFFENRIPLSLALLATYVFTAYFFIPLVIRIIRLFIRYKHIPLYCVTPDGLASDPLNIGIIGTRTQIVDAMTKAGWYMADRKTIRSGFRLAIAIVFRRSYLNAPFSSLFLFGRKQDLGFQIPIEDSSSNRHHVRFWACHLDGPEEFHKDVVFWQRFHKPEHMDDKRQLWVGAASKDIGIIPIRHTAQLTHMIDPNTDAERDLIVETLRSTHSVAKTRTVKVDAPYEVRNRTMGGFLQADGKMRICTLKD